MKRIDIAGKMFGRWVAMYPIFGSNKWHCRCACGAEKDVSGPSLRSGESTSCGCFRSDRNLTHGHARKRNKTSTYKTWYAMIQRCTNPRHKQFSDYGKRGISVCADWSSFDAFLRDMGPRPEGLTLDRTDNNRGYEKANCRWLTRSVQQLNRRTNRILELGGVSKPLTTWAREVGIAPETVRSRLRSGLPASRAVLAPLS